MLGTSSVTCEVIPLAILSYLWDLAESTMRPFLLQMLGYREEFVMKGISVPSNSFRMEAIRRLPLI